MRSLSISLTLITGLIAGCSTPTPIYKEPTDIADTARLSLSLSDESLIAGIAIVGIVEGEIICGQPLPNYRKMIVISKGNPLVKDLNRNGALIPGGQKIVLSVSGLNDGFKGCGRTFSFTPKPNGNYEIGMANTTMRKYYKWDNVRIECPVVVTEAARDDRGNVVGKGLDITYESCRNDVP